jgi:hypothetical protein
VEKSAELSLLDLAGCDPIDYLLVYYSRPEAQTWWTRRLDPRYSHVEVWREIEPGFYFATQPSHDYLVTSVVEAQPPGIVQRVSALRRRGKVLWPVGLKTCVTIAKAMLGVRAAWVITPKQLHDYVAQRRGIV